MNVDIYHVVGKYINVIVKHGACPVDYGLSYLGEFELARANQIFEKGQTRVFIRDIIKVMDDIDENGYCIINYGGNNNTNKINCPKCHNDKWYISSYMICTSCGCKAYFDRFKILKWE